MRLATVLLDGTYRTALVEEDDLLVLPASAPCVDDVVTGGQSALDTVHASLPAASRMPAAEARFTAPLRRFRRDVLCTGWNYWDHFEESRGRRDGQEPAERPAHPTFFTKAPDTVTGPYDDIGWDPDLSQAWDYEAELAFVVGKTGRTIDEHAAMDHVFGYLVANDVSQRDLQRAHGGQWFKGKSIDGTMPLGPWLTTADEVPDPHALRIRCEVNGHTYQDASTAQMAFRLPRLVAELSRGMTLHAGDVVLTGTPAGIGNARTPQVFLRAGDELLTTVESLGELRNKMVYRKLT